MHWKIDIEHCHFNNLFQITKALFLVLFCLNVSLPGEPCQKFKHRRLLLLLLLSTSVALPCDVEPVLVLLRCVVRGVWQLDPRAQREVGDSVGRTAALMLLLLLLLLSLLLLPDVLCGDWPPPRLLLPISEG